MQPTVAKQLPLSHEATAIAVSADGKRLAASALGNARTVVYDLRVGRVLFRFGIGATALALSPDGTRLVTAWSDDHRAASSPGQLALESRADDDSSAFTVRVFDLVTGRCLTPEPLRGEAPLALSPDGRLLAVAADRFTSSVLIYRLEGGELVYTLEYPHGRRLRSLAWSPCGRILSAANGISPVVHWRMSDREPFLPEGVRDDDVAVAFSPTGSLLAAAERDCRVRLVDLPPTPREGKGVVLAVRNGARLLRGVAALDFSPDGALVVARGRTGATQLYSVPLARPLWTASPGPLAFLPDGKTLAAWWCGAIWLRDAESGDLQVYSPDDPTTGDEPPGGPVSRTFTLRSRELEGGATRAPAHVDVIVEGSPSGSSAETAALLRALAAGIAAAPNYRTAPHLAAADADGLGVRLPLPSGFAYVQIRPFPDNFRIAVTVTADEPDNEPPPSSSLVRLRRWIRDRLGAEARRQAASDREWLAGLTPLAAPPPSEKAPRSTPAPASSPATREASDVRIDRGPGSITITLERPSLPSLEELELLVHIAEQRLGS